MAASKKPKPSRNAHFTVSGARWYEDAAGIRIYQNYLDAIGRCMTIKTRILWRHLIPAAKRCGRIK